MRFRYSLVHIAGVFVFLLTIGTAVYMPTRANAVSTASWQAGNIISDLVFTDSSSMTVGQIQNFLNSLVPNCDTNGTQPATEYGRSDLTHAQYAATRGWPAPPYICLRNYYEVPKTSPGSTVPANNYSGSIPAGAVSAAQLIYNASQQYHINPKVLLVKIQTESAGPLTKDTWPLQTQYTYAMGAHCPDSGPNNSANCDPNYAGFSIQISEAAALFRYYLDNMSQPWWPYKKPGNNVIQYNPSTSCGSSTVNIISMATAALYTYTPYQPNAAALAAGYGTATCGAYGNRNFWLYYNDWFGSTQAEQTLLTYKSHLSYLGWTGTTTNNGMTGTIGQSRPMEAFKINGDVEYSSYSYAAGWQPTVNQGMISGTTDQSRPIEAIKINPTGTLAANYDIYYRVQVSYIGWMGWTKNGQPAGITGDNTKDIEAIEIYIAPKGFSAPGTTTNPYQDNGVIAYNPSLSLSVAAHVGGIGWQPTVTDDMIAGTTEQDKSIEAIKIGLNNNTALTGNIMYSAHLAGIGWQGFQSDGAMAGTTGQFRRMEAIRIALTGQLGSNYDIWYRGYVRYIGWLNWAENGAPAGSVGASLHLEAIEIRIAPKDSLSLPKQNSLYNPASEPLPDNYSLSYSTQVSYLGWINNTPQNVVGGTTGQSRTMEAITFNSSGSLFGDLSITCSAYVNGTGWMLDIATGGLCGTVGQSKPLGAIKLSLSGEAATKYDLYYKVSLSWLGWQDWVMNGTQAGTLDSSTPIEAIVIKLVPK